MNEIIKHESNVSMESLMRASSLLASGGMFVHPKTGKPLNDAEVFSITEYGRELGIEPVIALQNIVPVKGRLCTSASIMLAMAKMAGVKYKILTERADECSIQFERDGQIYISKFDKKEAEQAGLLAKDNWRNYPVDMFRARAIARGCRFVVPDKLAGLYLAEELNDVTTAPVDILPEKIEMVSLSKFEHEKENEGEQAIPREPLATEKQVAKIHIMINKSEISIFESVFRDYLFELEMLEIDKSFKGITKHNASNLIRDLDNGSILIKFYADEKYHDELKDKFKSVTKEHRINVLLSMAPLINDLGTLPKKITDELTDQQTYDYFSLFLKAIHNEESNRDMNDDQKIEEARKMFDATIVVDKSKISKPTERKEAEEEEDPFDSFTSI